MEMVINQEEFKKIIKDHIEKQGHAINSIELFVTYKQPEEILRKSPQMRAQPYNYSSSTEYLNINNLQTLLDKISFYIVCKIDS